VYLHTYHVLVSGFACNGYNMVKVGHKPGLSWELSHVMPKQDLELKMLAYRWRVLSTVIWRPS